VIYVNQKHVLVVVMLKEEEQLLKSLKILEEEKENITRGI
jgi:hypothetical protein